MNVIKIGLLLILSSNVFICSFNQQIDNNLNKVTINIKSIARILQEHREIEYIKLLAPYFFNCSYFFNQNYQTNVMFHECFILNIPQGRVQGFCGHVLLGNDVIAELLWTGQIEILNSFIRVSEDKILKIADTVVVLAQPACDSYCHFMHEILGRLALIEMSGISYDHLYIPLFKPYTSEMLDLWGVEPNKVMVPVKNDCCVQAKRLVVPSLVLNSDIGFVNAGFRPHPQTSEYVRNKLLEGALRENIDTTQFSKKVFISRKDAPQRRILNEDAIFEKFEPYGFVRYELSKMSVAQQIMLMYNADMVVAEHGAGLTNILFCKQGVLVLELFQKLIDNSNWWVANIAQLNYVPVNCLDEDVSWAADWKKDIKKYWNAWSAKTIIPLDKIDEVIEKYIARKGLRQP